MHKTHTTQLHAFITREGVYLARKGRFYSIFFPVNLQPFPYTFQTLQNAKMPIFFTEIIHGASATSSTSNDSIILDILAPRNVKTFEKRIYKSTWTGERPKHVLHLLSSAQNDWRPKSSCPWGLACLPNFGKKKKCGSQALKKWGLQIYSTSCFCC